MSSYTDKLYQLLPAIYRIRDAEQGGKLQALLEMIGEQADVMDADIARLHDNLFIETCDEWVVPYLGDLLGVRGLHPVSDATFSQRARVANTLRYRRRKGTAAMLEQLTRDTTGWNARVVEFFQRLGTTQYLNHHRPQNLRTPDLRDANALELIGTPFDTAARTADVRHIASGRGQFNLPNIGLFLWRLQAYPVERAPAFDQGAGRYSFSQLGNDIPLFNPPVTEEDIAHLAEERNVPGRLRRRPLYDELEAWRQALADQREPQPIWFGKEPVLQVFLDGSDEPVPPEKILICHLGAWTVPPHTKTYHRVKPNGTLENVECLITVAVDPELGRLTFPNAVKPAKVEVSYAYGFSSELGGGFYDREYAPVSAESLVYPIAKSLACDSLKKAVATWKGDGSPPAIFVIQDSAYYEEKFELSLPAGVTLEIRAGQNTAGQQQRPVLLLKGPWKITGETPDDEKKPGGTLILNGLWLANNQVQVQKGDLAALQFQHCTLVPGWSLNPDGTATDPGEASLKVAGANRHLQISFAWSLAGKLELASAEKLVVQDSIIAAEDEVAIAGPVVVVERSTILGRVKAGVVQLASNSIFTGAVVAERRQEGCVRFCSLPLTSEVSRRHRCQPSFAIQQALEAAAEKGQTLTAVEQAALATRLQPVFTSERYGEAGFCQLPSSGPREIFSGADDESEMGAFHHLYEPQREANLRASLDEYLRAGLEAGIFYVD